MLNRDWILNFKDTNKIQQVGRGELPLMCALRCCSRRSQILHWARRGRWSITRRKWPLALILISAGLEQISLHLSPYLSLSQTTARSQSGYLEATASEWFRDMLWVGDRHLSRRMKSFPHILFIVQLIAGILSFRRPEDQKWSSKNYIVGRVQVGLSNGSVWRVISAVATFK